jgi:cytochrome c-type biogenesis protein CcmH/NrfF
MFKDYKCADCGHMTEYRKEYGIDFPEHLECEKCQGDMIKQFSAPLVDVAEGMLGNAKNGYSNSTVYHRSAYSPARRGEKY